MRIRWQRVRPVMWALAPIVGVAMLFLLPWLIRELRPLSSDALFQEARAELGAAHARYARAAAHYVRALASTGDIDRALAFIQSLPQKRQAVRPARDHPRPHRERRVDPCAPNGARASAAGKLPTLLERFQ
jgi:hypothetical protein